ncbi:MAG TPA: LamG domain-containing protein [Woeseiaceae bacterium]|nr:LamG domain-containing protein [Woeseiaceae bacterium]
MFSCTTILAALAWAAAAGADVVVPSLAGDLVVHYGFDHMLGGDDGRERDLGHSGTELALVNGGALMRVDDPAYPGAGRALETRQVDPGRAGNDDWKAGVYREGGVSTLSAFNGVAGITLMGWVKPTGRNPGAESNTPEPDDSFGAVGLFGLLSGTSDGHLVRALIEVIDMGGTFQVVALGRRVDDGESLLLAADGDWEAIVPPGAWTHLAATFDYEAGTMALYRNGEPLPADYTSTADHWRVAGGRVAGGAEPGRTSATDPAGIKIGGSYPQNTVERNPFNGRFDDLMFFDRALSADEVRAQFEKFGFRLTDFRGLTSARGRG